MADKVKTPPPPRKVQVPQQRGQTRDERRARLILYGIAGLGIVALVVVVSLLAFGGGGSKSAKDAIEAAGGSLQVVQALASANHVDTAPPKSTYNTWPPTSGPHNPNPPPFDVYSEPVEQYRLVHDMEHGGIVIQYGADVPSSTVDEIVAWYRKDPNGITIAPFPELGDEITLGAWTAPSPDERGTAYLARLPKFDKKAFDAFKNDYGFQGPERFPRELLTPGT